MIHVCVCFHVSVSCVCSMSVCLLCGRFVGVGFMCASFLSVFHVVCSFHVCVPCLCFMCVFHLYVFAVSVWFMRVCTPT